MPRSTNPISSFNNFAFFSDPINFLWIHLRDRLSHVECNAFRSINFVGILGVSQGCVLRPLLLNNFINDIVDEIQDEYFSYAEELKLHYNINSNADNCMLQSALGKVGARRISLLKMYFV